MRARPYQTELDAKIHNSWRQGARNTLAVLPTGGGKTWIFSNIIKNNTGPAVAIAHRQEIVAQISLSLAKHGVRHRLIAPNNVVKLINRLHMDELGRSFYNPSAAVAVAGVDTLIRRRGLGGWFDSVTLWVQDEAHHVLAGNKWGAAASLFKNARGLGVTATPLRADGKGLGRHADGLFDDMAEGPGMRDLINGGYLSDYRIFAPPSNLDMSQVKTGANGDWTQPGVKAAVGKSTVVGDVVTHYLRIAMGKPGITFAVDVETATDIAAKFNAAGVSAAVVSAKTADPDRVRILRDFKNGKYQQLVNVDLFGEGFDLPAVEVVSMARPTQSYGLYAQQFGRALRLSPGKPHAIIIDHVGNVIRHGLPDARKVWALDARERRSKGPDPDVIPVKACPSCAAVYERIYKTCPYCGETPKPMARSGPEFVDGDLTEMDEATLAAMRGHSVDVGLTSPEYLAISGAGRLPHMVAMSAAKKFRAKQAAQTELRASIALWAGYQRAAGRPDSESYRRFYLGFGVDVLSAQALGTREAEKLKLVIDRAVINA